MLDAWIDQHQQRSFDEDGAWAAAGSVQPALLEQCLRDPYFALAPPKSTGKERFNLPWIERQLAALEAAPEPLIIDPRDTQRTLTELTARTVLEAIPAQDRAFDRLILCGGGRHNSLLVNHMAALTDAAVAPCESLGLDGDTLEAGLFAWLAHCALEGIESDVEPITGACGPRLLGGRYPA